MTMLLPDKSEGEFLMTTALKTIIRSELPTSVAFRHTEVKAHEATHRIAGILGTYLHHIGFAKNDLDAQRLRRFALQNNNRGFTGIIVIVLPPKNVQPLFDVQKGR
jgi:hypothetical protein